jgi:hypothetical protein
MRVNGNAVILTRVIRDKPIRGNIHLRQYYAVILRNDTHRMCAVITARNGGSILA